MFRFRFGEESNFHCAENHCLYHSSLAKFQFKRKPQVHQLRRKGHLEKKKLIETETETGEIKSRS